MSRGALDSQCGYWSPGGFCPKVGLYSVGDYKWCELHYEYAHHLERFQVEVRKAEQAVVACAVKFVALVAHDQEHRDLVEAVRGLNRVLETNPDKWATLDAKPD